MDCIVTDDTKSVLEFSGCDSILSYEKDIFVLRDRCQSIYKKVLIIFITYFGRLKPKIYAYLCMYYIFLYIET
jgi:hypothetical protein